MKQVMFALVATMLVYCSFSAPADLNPVKLHRSPRHAPVIFVADGEARGVIVVTPQTSRALLGTVNELQGIIKVATGVELAIVKEMPAEGAALVIGDATASGIKPAKLPIEGFVIKSAPNRVYITGNDEGGQGTAWGVYEFAERFVGVRWYWPTDRGGRSIEPLKELIIDPVHLSDAPVFRRRVIWPNTQFTWVAGGQNLGALHRALRSANSWPNNLVVHSPNWSKMTDYLENRPEVYELRADGTRNTAMLCYGNPRTIESYLEQIEARLCDSKKGNIGLKGKSVTVSPADMEITCTCSDCTRLWDAGAGQYGTASRIMANFVDKLAREMKKRWPDLTIVYLPYLNYTMAPKGYKFPGNVEVQLCGMPGLAAYKEPAINSVEQANIDAWVAITGRKIQNWHYSCWPEDRTKAPYHYYHTVRDHYLHNRNKTVGTFINGVTDHWPRQHFSLYCWLKVLWNPKFDVDAAVEEFARRMYGLAAAPMLKLVKEAAHGWEDSRWPKGKLTSQAIYGESFPRERVEKMRQLLADARKLAADNAEIIERIDYYERPFAAFYIEADAVIDGVGVRPMTAQKVGMAPKIDGKLDDESWQRATPVRLVKNGTKETEAQYPTDVRALWTTEAIYFGFEMVEPLTDKLERDIEGRDASLAWWNDNVELLLDVSGDGTGETLHFIINPNGAVYDARGGDTSWNVEGMEVAALIDKDSWSLEIGIPYKSLPDLAVPGTGVEWSAQLTRHRVADSGLKEGKTEGSVREYQLMNGRFGGFSSNRANFAPIRFQE